jgi:phage replication O-like protein O
MASPQVENGHVKIASEIIEALARVNLRPYEWRVLLVVLRKTYGWNKKLDEIAVSQIAKGTGLYKQHASEARKTLLEKQVLVEKDGKIGLNKNYEEWRVKRTPLVTDSGDAKVTDSSEKVTDSSDKTSRKQVPQKTITTNNSNTAQSDTGRHSPTSPTQAEAEAEAYKPHSPLSKDRVAFDIFWQLYPRKVGKGAAKKVWAKLKPNDALVQRILEAVSEQRDSVQWARDGGQYIPHPTTWLNQERWEDELEPLYHDPTPEEADAFFARRKAENEGDNVGGD